MFSNISVNARLGIANWGYDKATPRSRYGYTHGNSGIDAYYSLGAEYKVTEDVYLGLEYSIFEYNSKYNDKNFDDLGYFGFTSHNVKDLSLILGWVF